VSFADGWPDTLKWFRANWLPTYRAPASFFSFSLAKNTQRKIDIQLENVAENPLGALAKAANVVDRQGVSRRASKAS